jgi:hypothetical protein
MSNKSFGSEGDNKVYIIWQEERICCALTMISTCIIRALLRMFIREYSSLGIPFVPTNAVLALFISRY